MSIPEAIKGARAEFSRITSPIEKAKRALIYFRIIAAELFGTITLAPFGARSYLLHRSLPNASQWGAKKHQGVSIVRDVRYGPAERNVMDVYLPPNWEQDGTDSNRARDTNKEVERDPMPSVLFCHGGVWATGEKWHYAPLATRLAQAGIITAVMQYTLYPEATAPHMAKEVSMALTAVMDSATAWGGDAAAVSLMGHSAGAQLCAMALLQRAHHASISTKSQSTFSKAKSIRRVHAASGNDINTNKVDPQQLITHKEPQQDESSSKLGEGAIEDAVYGDSRMPERFISMAGVFDIAKHYEYEEWRHVHELSTMARAVGGPERFAAESPSVILQQAVLRDNISKAKSKAKTPSFKALHAPQGVVGTEGGSSNSSQGSSFYKSFQLQGEGIAHRIGLYRTQTTDQAVPSSINQTNAGTDTAAAPFFSPPALIADPAASGVLPLSLADVRRLPPVYLQSSCTDVTVPWFESAEMHWALTDCGVRSKSLVYNGLGHGDFVVEWRPVTTLRQREETGDLPPFAADVVQILKQ